jgi:hypothetical protein
MRPFDDLLDALQSPRRQSRFFSLSPLHPFVEQEKRVGSKRFGEGGRCDGFVRNAVPRWEVGGEGGVERFGGRDGATAISDVVAEVGGTVVNYEGGEAVEVSMW